MAKKKTNNSPEFFVFNFFGTPIPNYSEIIEEQANTVNENKFF